MPASLNLSFNDLLTTTLWKYMETLADNVTKGYALLDLLKQRGAIGQSQHGQFIIEPLLYNLPKQLQWLSPWQPFDIRPWQVMTVAYYPYRKAVVSLAVAGEEVRSNNTPAALMNLLQTKLQALELGVKEAFTEALMAASPAANAIHSIPQIVNNTGVVGNIDPAVDTWWQSAVQDGGGTTQLTWARLGTFIVTNLVFGSSPDMSPDLIVTTPALWDSLHQQLSSTVRIDLAAQMQDITYGFGSLRWRGVLVVMDKSVPAGTVFVLNTRFLKIRHRLGTLFETVPTRYDDRQDVHYAFIRFEGNLVTNNRRMHGQMKNFTP